MTLFQGPDSPGPTAPASAPAPLPAAPRRFLPAGRACLAAVVVQILWFVFFYRQFIFGRLWATSDDIYISACFARTFAAGHGLVWFPGAPRVEGITNPLWTVILALIHKLPHFHEDKLGLYLAFLNVPLLAAVTVLFWRVLRRAAAWGAAPADTAEPLSGRRAWLVALLAATALLALPYWMAEGFEVGLLALLALLGFHLSLGRCGPRQCLLIGLLAGLAFWTRMDGVLYFAAAGVMVAWPRRPGDRSWGRLALIAASSGAMLAALLLARKAYYGEWLPNTYYLKLAGWPLRARLSVGWHQNWPHAVTFFLIWIPLLVPAWRRRLGPVLPPLVAAFVTYALAILYSTHNGGDAWGLKAGYDRFALLGGLFLLFGGALLVTGLPRLPRSWRAGAFLCLWLALLLPMLMQPGFFRFMRECRKLNKERAEYSWIRYGQILEKISRPGARVAISPAGAIIYFSHRGGVDLYGKCEPLIAHQSVTDNTRPGHNKKTEKRVAELFKLRRPEFSKEAPPREVRALYRKMDMGRVVWVLKDTPFAQWPALKPLE